jgi:hypothetical protein
VIYVIEDRQGHVKIGWSKNPPRRLKTLQTAQPHTLYLVKVYPGTEAWLEKRIHSTLARLKARHKGEWFICTDLKALIDTVDLIVEDGSKRTLPPKRRRKKT